MGNKNKGAKQAPKTTTQETQFAGAKVEAAKGITGHTVIGKAEPVARDIASGGQGITGHHVIGKHPLPKGLAPVEEEGKS